MRDEDRLTEIDQRLSENINMLSTKMRNLEMALQNVDRKLQRPDSVLEQRISDLEHLFSGMELKLLNNGQHSHLDENFPERKLDALETNIENILSRLNMVETQKSLQISETRPTSATIGQENIKTRNMGAELAKLEETVTEYLQNMNHKLDLKMIDIEEKLDKAFDGIPSKDSYEKNIESRVINMLSEKIEHFARMLDKKLLEYPSRPEIEKRLVRLEGMIAMIEHPNLRPMEQRLGELELRIADLTRFMHRYAERVPMVVE
ncbi:MAG: hypothetical protein HZB65_00685 [Candidatus Aenigmarchaeota archaeon]|nr:hypothetical protein [Candidatus Aenigmarchaeota archaeon]